MLVAFVGKVVGVFAERNQALGVERNAVEVVLEVAPCYEAFVGTRIVLQAQTGQANYFLFLVEAGELALNQQSSLRD